MFQPTVIVLAAGKGARFIESGGQGHKLDAMLGGRPVLDHTMSAVEASGLRWHLVIRADGDGMADSIASGVVATPDADGWLVLPGDLPFVRPQSLQSVANALQAHSVVVPYCHEQHGHPVGFGRECFSALVSLSGESGAASIVRGHRLAGKVLDLPVNDIGIITDVDTVDDLVRAKEFLEGKHGKH